MDLANEVGPPVPLVDRLRDPSDGWSGDAFCIDAETAEEAAAEIERLRAGLNAAYHQLVTDRPSVAKETIAKCLDQQLTNKTEG